jgi:hypothetical protein
LPSIWGWGASEFNPSRFNGFLPEQKQVYIPFGAGKLKCPASNWAPGLAAVIAGGILTDGRIVIQPPVTGPAGNLGVVDGGRKGWDEWRVDFVRRASDQV